MTCVLSLSQTSANTTASTDQCSRPEGWNPKHEPWEQKVPVLVQCKLPWAPAMYPAAKDGWPLSRKLFGSLCWVLRLLTRAHPGLSYCPYKTAQGECEPNVLSVPGRKMLTMNPCGRTVQYNCKDTQPALWGGPKRNMQVSSGLAFSFCSNPAGVRAALTSTLKDGCSLGCEFSKSCGCEFSSNFQNLLDQEILY